MTDRAISFQAWVGAGASAAAENGILGDRLAEVYKPNGVVAHSLVIRHILKMTTKEVVADELRDLGDFICVGAGDYLIDKQNTWIARVSVTRTGKYSEVRLNLDCRYEDESRLKKMFEKKLKKLFANVKNITKCHVSWFYLDKGELKEVSVTEMIKEAVHDEAYPEIPEGIDAFLDEYFQSDSSILILIGPPGMGKSRLIRYMLCRYGAKMETEPTMIFTSDKNAVEVGDQFFIKFRTENHDFMVLEDIDHLLSPRDDTGGNDSMHKFLSASDGVLSVDGTSKIVLSTNLSINEIDEAVLRPGRCFAAIDLRSLNRKEANKLYTKICKKKPRKNLFNEDHNTVAEIYLAAKGKKKTHLRTNRKVGFKAKIEGKETAKV